VVQSLKVHGHNYSMESIFLIRNLAKSTFYGPNRDASFVRKELSHWRLEKNGKYTFNYRFVLVPSNVCVAIVSEMHQAIRSMNSSLQAGVADESFFPCLRNKGFQELCGHHMDKSWLPFRMRFLPVYFWK